jgi:hypothetical protein
MIQEAQSNETNILACNMLSLPVQFDQELAKTQVHLVFLSEKLTAETLSSNHSTLLISISAILQWQVVKESVG